MDKPAVTNLTLHPIINTRWSPRSFNSQIIDNDTLQRIFEAARWSPSSRNEQPWRFIVGKKGTKTWDMIFETLEDFNQKWAKLAPVLVITLGKETLSGTNKPNGAFQYDLGQSVAYMTFQAMHEGIYVHQMGGFDADKAITLFDVPTGYKALTTIAMGYKGNPELLEEKFQIMEKSERKRKPLRELVFEDEFGKTSQIL